MITMGIMVVVTMMVIILQTFHKAQNSSNWTELEKPAITRWLAVSTAAVAAPERQDGQVSTVVRQVISCELCEGPKVKPLCGWSVSQGASQGRSFLA